MADSIAITSDYITLAQFLKAENIIESGGQAKYYLAEHAVFLNDLPERQRGKKLYPGDVVLAEGKRYTITKSDEADAKKAEEDEAKAILARFFKERHEEEAKAKRADKPKGPGQWN
ncbi:RNA-binding S4 domain-containing protein [Eupransor demetentiae]|uniref:S4-like RNA-binding protein (YbcJ) n=1 Tax=Eupransor demetentiae TaxID=3109584 RepID=A0ABM9N551_9LACO|nr:Ribosome-associated protein YbcJ [Lactobacillaceae bacterium LMG 33000]